MRTTLSASSATSPLRRPSGHTSVPPWMMTMLVAPSTTKTAFDNLLATPEVIRRVDVPKLPGPRCLHRDGAHAVPQHGRTTGISRDLGQAREEPRGKSTGEEAHHATRGAQPRLGWRRRRIASYAGSPAQREAGLRARTGTRPTRRRLACATRARMESLCSSAPCGRATSMPRRAQMASTSSVALATTMGTPRGTQPSVCSSTGSPMSGSTSLLAPKRRAWPAASTATPTRRAGGILVIVRRGIDAWRKRGGKAGHRACLAGTHPALIGGERLVRLRRGRRPASAEPPTTRVVRGQPGPASALRTSA